MLKRIYEKVTGRPWLTVRSMAAEFGPTPATRYPELADYSDAELLRRGGELLAWAAERRARHDDPRAYGRGAAAGRVYQRAGAR